MVAAALRQAFLLPNRAAASQAIRHVADQMRPKWPKLAAFIDDCETNMLTHMDFPLQHRSKIHSTNPIERLNKEVKRRADVVGIIPNEASMIRLVGAVLLEQNDEWQMQHRYMQVEAMAELMNPLPRPKQPTFPPCRLDQIIASNRHNISITLTDMIPTFGASRMALLVLPVAHLRIPTDGSR